ncbi:MAG: DsbA family protein [Actinobacteria bacterium]|nr:DsbA family protein [Actinomycetota bacterium]
MKRPPRIYFSFRSPFSWLGLERLRRRFGQLPDGIELVPYWDPDPGTEAALQARDAEFHYVQMSKAKHLYILHDTKRVAEGMGLRMAWPVDVDPWWEVPHLGWLRARELGLGQAFFDAVIAARWGRGENVCDREVALGLARSIGLGERDAAAVAGACEDPAVREAGVECLAAAYDDDVFGVPYFRVGRHRFWGYDRVDGFADELVRALGLDGVAEVSPAAGDDAGLGVPASVGAAYDTDTAGGCG